MAITPSAIFWFAITVIFQLIGPGLLPASRGMTAPWPTAGVVIGYAVGVYAMSRVLMSGVDLSLFIPILSVVLMFGLIAIGVLIYGENASPVKLACLTGATVLIGVASRT